MELGGRPFTCSRPEIGNSRHSGGRRGAAKTQAQTTLHSRSVSATQLHKRLCDGGRGGERGGEGEGEAVRVGATNHLGAEQRIGARLTDRKDSSRREHAFSTMAMARRVLYLKPKQSS